MKSRLRVREKLTRAAQIAFSYHRNNQEVLDSNTLGATFMLMNPRLNFATNLASDTRPFRSELFSNFPLRRRLFGCTATSIQSRASSRDRALDAHGFARFENEGGSLGSR